MNSLINVSKFEPKLRRIIQLNEKGAVVYTNKSSSALAIGSSRSEFIEALKADVDDTAKDLINALPIIYSIKNGLVHEVRALDNSVEVFFGSTYKNGVVILSGYKFELSANKISKAEIVDTIYENVFGTNRKELNNLLKTLSRYETATDEIEKTLLYPSTILADILITKVGLIDQKFNEFRNELTYQDKIQFAVEFNRSGISEVIQNATYIDKTGVRQSIHSKQQSAINKIADGLKNNKFKYIEAVEVDGDAEVEKALRFINQIERLTINCEYKFTLKLRKLGNYKATGLFMSAGVIVAEDVRDTSALIHEIAHFIHLTNTEIYTSEFVNYMIEKLSKRIDFENVSEQHKDGILKKADYYNDPKEVIARALEVAAMFASEEGKIINSTDDFDMVKRKSHYEKFEGIYFNFKSFDEETKEEMAQLYTLFYETSFEKTKNTNLDNFVKINTRYNRVEIDRVCVADIIKKEKENMRKELKVLYGMVNSNNIKLIIDNRAKGLSLESLCTRIFLNLHFCGGHNTSMYVEDWTEVKEDKSKMILIMQDLLKSSRSELEFVEYLYSIDKDFIDEKKMRYTILDNIRKACGVEGFSTKFSKQVRDSLKLKYPDGAYFQYREFVSSMRGNVFNLASDDIINNYEYMKTYVAENNYFLSGLKDRMNAENLVKHSFDLLDSNKLSYFSYPKEAFSNRDFIENFFEKNPTKIDAIVSISEDLKSDVTLMTKVLNIIFVGGHSFDLKNAFTKLPQELIQDIEFVEYFAKKDTSLTVYLPKKIVTTKKIEVKPEVKKESKKKVSKKVEKAIVEDKAIEENFEEIIEKVVLEDYKHSVTGEDLKIFRVKEDLGKAFPKFRSYLKAKNIAYYSSFAKGFIVINQERFIAASLPVFIYSSDVLATFAQGKLF